MLLAEGSKPGVAGMRVLSVVDEDEDEDVDEDECGGGESEEEEEEEMGLR